VEREVRNQKLEVGSRSETERRANEVRSFRDLIVYQNAYRLSLEIHKATLGSPKMEQYALADQMRRSSKSICGNIAEGFAKQRASSAEFRRFIMIAIGPSDEMKVWLDYSRDLGYVDAAQVEGWQMEYARISRMLHRLIESWRDARNRKSEVLESEVRSRNAERRCGLPTSDF
jgi:four helix bundle protein